MNTINTVGVLGTQSEDRLEVSPLTDPHMHRIEDLSTTFFKIDF